MDEKLGCLQYAMFCRKDYIHFPGCESAAMLVRQVSLSDTRLTKQRNFINPASINPRIT